MTAFNDEVLNGVYHAAVSGEKEKPVQVYDEIGRPLTLLDARFEAEKMILVTTRSQGKPLPLSFEATRQDDRFEGNWVFVHPQYQTGGELHGTRVIRSPGWLPFEELRKQRKEKLVDINSVLLEGAPLRSFPKFLDFWNQQVEPVYYFFFQQWLYGDGTDPGLKKKQLTWIFHLLHSPGPELAFVTNFPQLLETALQQIKARVQQEDLGFYIVSSAGPQTVSSLRLWSRLPAPDDGTEKCCSRLVTESLNENYLVFNPFQVASNPETAAIFVKEEILLSTLSHGHAPSLGVEIFQHGLALYLAWEKEEKGFPAFPEEKLLAYKQGVKKDFAKGRDRIEEPYFAAATNPLECAHCIVGYDFARKLLSTHSLKDLLKWNESEVADEWGRYLNAVSQD